MKTLVLICGSLLLATAVFAQSAEALAEARRGFQTKLLAQEEEKSPFDEPPPNLFLLTSYLARSENSELI